MLSAEAGRCVQRLTLDACIRSSERCRQADAPGDGIQLGDHHAVSRGDDIRPNHRRYLVSPALGAGILQERWWLPLVKVARHPGRLSAADTLAVQLIECSVEGQQMVAERREECPLLRRQQERSRRNSKAGALSFFCRGKEARLDQRPTNGLATLKLGLLAACLSEVLWRRQGDGSTQIAAGMVCLGRIVPWALSGVQGSAVT